MSRWALAIDPDSHPGGVMRLKARFEFVEKSGRRPQTFRMTVLRCARAAVEQAPAFAGWRRTFEMTSFVTRSLLVAVLAAIASAPPAAGAVREPGAKGPLGDERLSDEKRITRWAHVAKPGPVRSAPRRDARAVARLRYWTEHGRPEVYLALESRRIDGRAWIRIRVPGRPNGRTGWVPAGALGALHVVRTRLVVDRRTAHATLYRDGKSVWRAPVGVGKPSTPTPAGRFWVREKLRGSGGVYGPWALGTAAYSVLSEWPKGGVIALHGTNQPGLLPGRPSNGCIRMRNADITRLVRLLPIGTPLGIR